MQGPTAVLCCNDNTRRIWPPDQPTPMERVRIRDPAPDQGTIRMTHDRAQELLPVLKVGAITAAWASYIDNTPDGVPAIGEVASIPGFLLAAGFSGHGFWVGQGAGHPVADILTGDSRSSIRTPIIRNASLRRRGERPLNFSGN